MGLTSEKEAELKLIAELTLNATLAAETKLSKLVERKYSEQIGFQTCPMRALSTLTARRGVASLEFDADVGGFEDASSSSTRGFLINLSSILKSH